MSRPEASVQTRICALITSHNRRSETLSAIDALARQQGVDLEIVLLDDASTDGTAEAVAASHPSVKLLHGTGTLYWNRGMVSAYRSIESELEQFSGLLLINDDTTISDGAIGQMVDTLNDLPAASIVVGSTVEPVSGSLSYGGVKWRVRFGRVSTEVVTPARIPIPCDTFNANCVLLTTAAIKTVGFLDPTFTHSMGDFDLGLRAKTLGVQTWVFPGVVGSCERNLKDRVRLPGRRSLRERIRHILSPKGLPPREWFVFTRRHGGWAWPILFVSPYVRAILPRRR